MNDGSVGDLKMEEQERKRDGGYRWREEEGCGAPCGLRTASVGNRPRQSLLSNAAFHASNWPRSCWLLVSEGG